MMSANEKRRPGRDGARSEPAGRRSIPNYSEPLAATTPVIVIDDEPFAHGFDVSVTPAQPVGHDRECRTHADAVRYAAPLSQATGWRVIDRSDAGSR